MRVATLLILLALAVPARAEPLRVVASIKPVHSLVAGVMAGVGTPELLVPGNASPHVYSMKPSDAKRLEAAQLVFWIGPIYESFLAKPLGALSKKATIVTLATADGMTVLPAREGGAWESHKHRHGAHQHKPGEVHDDDDGHLWLDPANARAIVETAATALAAADAANAARYRENGARLARDLASLDAMLQTRLAPVGKAPFIVFHDAYQYFERRYGLAAAGSITVSPEQKPGARRVREIRAKIEKAGAACVFAEPQFEPALVRTIAGDTKARGGILDPLGAGLADGPELYFRMMENLATALATCLAVPPS